MQLKLVILLQPGHKPFFLSIGCITVSAGISCFRANLNSFSHMFARITPRKADIARPSSCRYHESLKSKHNLLSPYSKAFSRLLFEFQEETPSCTVSVRQLQLLPSMEHWCTKFPHQEILWFHPDPEQVFNCFSGIFSIGFYIDSISFFKKFCMN